MEVFTDELVYIIADEAIRDRTGHILLIVKALYGRKSSDKRWWERCSEILHDIWIKDMGGYHEYLARYVDDIGIVPMNPKVIIDNLTTK